MDEPLENDFKQCWTLDRKANSVSITKKLLSGSVFHQQKEAGTATSGQVFLAAGAVPASSLRLAEVQLALK